MDYLFEYRLVVLAVEVTSKFVRRHGSAWSGHILPTFTIKIGSQDGSLPTSRSQFDEPVTVHGAVVEAGATDGVALFVIDPADANFGGKEIMRYGNFDWSGIGSHKYDFSPTKIADVLFALPPSVCEHLLEAAILTEPFNIDYDKFRAANLPEDGFKFVIDAEDFPTDDDDKFGDDDQVRVNAFGQRLRDDAEWLPGDHYE